MNKRTLKSIFSYMIGNLSSKLLSLFLIPVFAYFVSANDLGNYDYFTALLNIIVPISFMNIWDAELKYIIMKDASDYKKIISNIISIMICGQIILLVICGILSIVDLLDVKIIFLAYFYFTAYGWLLLLQYLCRGLKKNNLYVASSVISTIIHIILISALVIYFKLGFVGLVIADVASNLIIIIILVIRLDVVAYLSFLSIDFVTIRTFLYFSVPLTINVVSVWLTSGVSKIIVTKYVSAYANGIYSFGNRFSVILTTIGSVVNMALLEEAYEYKSLDEFRSKTKDIVMKMSKIYVSLVLVLLPVINIFFELALANTEYIMSVVLIPSFMLVSVINIISGIIGNAFTVSGKTNRLFICSIIGAAVNIVLGLLLIRYYSYYGVLIAQIAGTIVTIIAKAVFAYIETGLILNWSTLIVGSVLSILCGLVLCEQPPIVNLFSVVVFIAIVGLWNRKEIKNIVRLCWKRKGDNNVY